MPRNALQMSGLWTTRRFDGVTPPVCVLIVDDDDAMSAALEAALVTYGFRASVANGGVCAVSTPKVSTPHVVVLDIEMGECDGFTVAGAMRDSSRFATIPIIAHTSLPEAEVVERGRQVEIDAFHRKGSSLLSLFRLIEYLAPSVSA